MTRFLSSLFLLAAAAAAPAQEVPGLRVSMTTRSLVTSAATVELKLLLQVDADTEVPAALLTGAQLAVKCDDQPQPAIVQPGRGGAVALAAGTRLERTLSFPATKFMPGASLQQTATIAVAWEGMAGTACVFKIAPDTKNVDITTLDLRKTQVVLVTSLGDMTLEFHPDKAPKHVENFVKLSLQGFYDGTKFHRVIRDFMIQGGCPLTKDDSKVEQWGSGGPGYTINAEFNDMRHLRGTLSMARTSDPNSGGSGFFIVHKDSPHLDKNYSAFGSLVAGADTLDRIALTRVGGPSGSAPVQPVVLHAAVVLPVLKK
jgi:peptidyl-prolyl cis-trans isomerase B (cyclophilin B)